MVDKIIMSTYASTDRVRVCEHIVLHWMKEVLDVEDEKDNYEFSKDFKIYCGVCDKGYNLIELMYH